MERGVQQDLSFPAAQNTFRSVTRFTLLYWILCAKRKKKTITDCHVFFNDLQADVKVSQNTFLTLKPVQTQLWSSFES